MSSYVSDINSYAGRSACPFRRQRTDCVTSERGMPNKPGNGSADGAESVPQEPPDVPTEEVKGDEEETVRKGTAEEALAREHQMTHLPQKSSLRCLLQGKSTTQTEEEEGSKTRTMRSCQEGSREVW